MSDGATFRSPVATRGWREAMESALYGSYGFYTAHPPAAHFRTSVHASTLFAGAVTRLARAVDDALGRPDGFEVVDMAAGGGELLAALSGQAGEEDPRVPERWRLTAVEHGARPVGLPDRVGWRPTPPSLVTGLLIANEWLDNVPCDVVRRTPEGPRLVEVEPATGVERLAGVPDPADAEWLARWWPLAEVGDRAEIGTSRDRAWAGVVARVSRGVALAVDYGHTTATRPAHGTLTGYQLGRQVQAIPDGSRDITAHVSFDSCAAAGQAAGADETVLLSQREALHRLGVSGRRPPLERARRDPAGYLRSLVRAGEAAELTDPAGLGGFHWLVQARGTRIPEVLTA